MTWLDCYGLYREAGVNQFNTVKSLDENAAFVLSSQEDMEAGADAKDAETEAIIETVGGVLVAVGGLIVAVAGESVVGAVIGVLVAAVGFILSSFADWLTVECDKYHCGGHDRNTNARRRNYRRHVRALIGIYVPDERAWNPKDDCSCSRERHKCSFVRYFHDGLFMRGEDWGSIADSPANSGEIRGVNALVSSGQTNRCTETWRRRASTMPLDESDRELPVGGEPKPAGGYDRSPWDEPWKNDKESYYYRSWKVRAILEWMTGPGSSINHPNILCRSMECMEETLLNTSSAAGDSSFNQKRRRGSRWYSSLVWMMQDIWALGQDIVEHAEKPTDGWNTFGEVLRQSGVNKATLDTLTEMAYGKEYTPEELPFPWTPLFEQITFWQMRTILGKLQQYVPWVPDVPSSGGMPVGEAARERSPIFAPAMIPIREPVIFSQGMQPIPAKFGSRGIGWGTVALGLGAAAIGSYAIYKVLAPSEEE